MSWKTGTWSNEDVGGYYDGLQGSILVRMRIGWNWHWIVSIGGRTFGFWNQTVLSVYPWNGKLITGSENTLKITKKTSDSPDQGEVSFSTLELNVHVNYLHKKFWKELIAYFPLKRHGPHRKWRLRQLFIAAGTSLSSCYLVTIKDTQTHRRTSPNSYSTRTVAYIR
jgi:hypothetical protein